MKILAFGEVMMRMMPPQYKTLSQADILEFLFTGTGVNVLSGLYQMEDDVYLATCLPDNAIGKAASAHLRKLGIHDDFVVYKGHHIGMYFLEKGIGNRSSQVTYMDRQASSFGQSQMSDYDFSCLDDMDVLHVCGISLAINETLRDITLAFVKEAKRRNVKIVFDCNFRPSLWNQRDRETIKNIYEEMLSFADIVFAGYKDATLLLEKEVDESLPLQEQVERLLIEMCQDYQIEAIFGTQRATQNGKDYLSGYFIKEKEMIMSPQYELTVYDRIGAGDGFATGAIHGYLHHMEAQTLIDYATVSGVLAHTLYGDSFILGKADIFDFMKNGKTDLQR